jgi:hypothetical protein
MESRSQNKKPPGSRTWGPLLQAKSEDLFTNNKGKKKINSMHQI